MILVLAGTRDGRELAAKLANLGFSVMASVVSVYGQQLAQEKIGRVHEGMLDETGLVQLIQQEGICLLVDASHPYAVNVSRHAMQACNRCGVEYLRYERPSAVLPDYERLIVTEDYPAAAQTAAGLGHTVFLTTGSRHLGIFKNHPCLQQHRLIARVLPEPDVLAECIKLGFQPKDIVALQGPFSHELNMALFKDYQADVVISKNSGSIGGTDTKISAAIELGLPLVVIDRPPMEYSNIVHSFEQVLQQVEQHFRK
ncbi:hypothetical protein P22_0073 [Propionispora sp. 2/2-37]|uniref:precorrin-6A reductase n=1 Tax=Propionispora sp. 2/2-37 TaxID=1677858 RepID=UPI0006BB751C|nr:precorrin-6A reductase [Propionispora sp. 2/2-37]CUH94011.1 hypothetical protein P22_0073 [Propionispora sp. 2/2-37]